MTTMIHHNWKRLIYLYRPTLGWRIKDDIETSDIIVELTIAWGWHSFSFNFRCLSDLASASNLHKNQTTKTDICEKQWPH